jgi:hypothetical protein
MQRRCAYVLVEVGVRHPLVYNGSRLGDALPAAQEVGMAKSLRNESFARIPLWGIQARAPIGFLGSV